MTRGTVMASLTVRQLDDRLKRLLRLRAARHGRSMEDEVRTILAHAAQDADQEALEAVEPPVRAARQIEPARATEAKRVVLIIGGGIAAYKSLDLIRRLGERGTRVRCILTAAAQHFVTPLALGALAPPRRPDWRSPRGRRLDCQNRHRPPPRPRRRRPARKRQAGIARAGDEPA